MMIIVGKLAETGLFEVCTAYVVDLSKGSLFRLAVVMSVLTAVMSAFLDNVTTMILLVPITIELCSALKIDPIPLLITETFFSNVGGSSTLIGDPPNIIVGSAFSSEVSFVDFLGNMLPGIAFMFIPSLYFLKWQYGDAMSGPLIHFKDAQKVAAKFKIKDWPLLRRSGVVLLVVLIAFVTHSVHHVNPAWVSLLGAIALMIASSPHEVEHALHSVEWDTLLFFAALFVMVEGMAELGLIRTIADGLTNLIKLAPVENQTIVAIVVLIWASAIVSAFLDNIPYTATMVPVIRQLADPDEGLGLDLPVLIWALCFGACLGGNGTLIGASANIIVSSIAERHGHKITFMMFFRKSFPFMLLTTALACVYMVIRYGVQY
jgi:Na+/H+ antiporter NhaD/arsenite permease-like protein